MDRERARTRARAARIPLPMEGTTRSCPEAAGLSKGGRGSRGVLPRREFLPTPTIAWLRDGRRSTWAGTHRLDGWAWAASRWDRCLRAVCLAVARPSRSRARQTQATLTSCSTAISGTERPRSSPPMSEARLSAGSTRRRAMPAACRGRFAAAARSIPDTEHWSTRSKDLARWFIPNRHSRHGFSRVPW